MMYTHNKIHTKKRLLGPKKVKLATVSGVVTTKPSLITYVDTHLPIEVITTKSFQVFPNEGNREPIICEVEAGNFGNSVGLRNSGMKIALQEIQELRKNHTFRALLNISLSASTVEDFITLVGAFEEVADILELNFSCPHAAKGFGSDIGTSVEISSMYMREIKKAFPNCKALIFPKLTPNVDNIGEIASSLIENGADGLVAINTVGPVIHIDPTSKQPILQNALGGKGGKSGSWIFDRALQCIKEIRQAVGDEIPIIGMGGVSHAHHASEMIASGANVVGVGSAFAKVNQKMWKSYIEELKSETQKRVDDPSIKEKHCISYYNTDSSMSYHQRTIIKKELLGNDTLLLTMDGRYDFSSGQFIFVWLPGVGEKPFSVATVDPFTLIVKKRGAFTQALFALEEQDLLYVRGLYGSSVQTLSTKKALLIAGGTGVAVLPSLANKLHKEEVEVTTFVGTSNDMSNPFEKELQQYGTCTTINDDGVVARVLDVVNQHLSDVTDLGCYLVGPTAFMSKAAEMLVDKGVNKEHILLSLELNTMCGVGLCGECACGDRLTCQWGTFMSYDYILTHAKELL